MPIVVRETKVTLVVGVLDMIVFLPCMVLSFWSEWQQNGLVAACIVGGLFSLFVLLDLVLLMTYRNRCLVLTGAACRYTTWRGRTRHFALSDVAQAERVSAGGSVALVLLDRQGKKLAQIEMNMAGAQHAHQWLLEQSVAFTERRAGMAANGDWNNPAWEKSDSWQMRHRRGIKCAVIAVSVAAIVVALAGWLVLPSKVRKICWLLLPLALLALHLAFSEVVVFQKPATSTKDWKKSHIAFPFMIYLIVCLSALSDVRYLYLIDGGKCIVLGIVIFAALLALYFGVVPKKRRGAATTVSVVMLFLAYAFLGVYHINYVLRFAPPVHISAAVVDSDVYQSAKRTSYSITLLPAKGEQKKYSVSRLLYERATSEHIVQLCQQQSVLASGLR